MSTPPFKGVSLLYIGTDEPLPFRVGRREVAASASIGIALSASGYERPEDVLHDADAAMYRAKASGRSRYEVYDTDMHSRALAQLQLEVDLRVAVENEEIVVHYQPQEYGPLDARPRAGSGPAGVSTAMLAPSTDSLVAKRSR